MNRVQFFNKVGRPPRQNDLRRANCKKVGLPGHKNCGVCQDHGLPVFLCPICLVASNEGKKVVE